MAERIWYIKSCRLFEQLGPDQFRRLERCARVRHFAKKAPVYLSSDASDSVFLLAEGRVKLCSTTPDGKQAILAFIEPGELFGELSLLEPSQRDEHAEAMSDSVVVLFPGEALMELMNESAPLALGVTKIIGLRRKRVERRLKSLLFRSNRDRLIHLLVDLAGQYGQASSDGILLSIRLSHQDFAAVIGATRETVTSLLGELQLEGLIKVARQRLVVRNLDQLARIIDREPPPLSRESPAAQRILPTATPPARLKP